MKHTDILEVLKTDVQISATAYDSYLGKLINLAKESIEREGIVLKIIGGSDESPDYREEDAMLIEMYAAYLYRKRKEDNAPMPRMLRYALNNRLFQQKAQEKTNG